VILESFDINLKTLRV